MAQAPCAPTLPHPPPPNQTTNRKNQRHSLHAIASQLSPAPRCAGIDLLSTDAFDLHCLQAPTGTKFLAVAEPQAPQIPSLLAQ